MAGYVARSGAVSGVLDPLEVGVVVLAGPSGQIAALCVVDLVQIDAPLADRCRVAVADALGTSSELVWMTATHTHAGPFPDDVAHRVEQASVAAAREAWRESGPVRVTLHRVELDGVGAQRTGEARRSAVPVDVLRFSDESALVGVVGVLPVHPTVLGADNTRVSADLPGGVRRAVARDSSAWCLVATGAAGDVSTRSHRREQTPEEVDRLGAIVAERVLDPGEAIATATDVVRGRVTTIELAPAREDAPFRVGAGQYARRALEAAVASGDPVQVREATVALQGVELGHGESDPVPCAVSALDLGGVRLVGLGGEPFLDLAETAAGLDPATVLVGYANGYAGYLPTRAAFAAADADHDHPSYEVLISRVAPGEPGRALAAATALLGHPESSA
jgi:neutral ceramidase